MSTTASPEETPAKAKSKAVLILPLAVVVLLLGLMAYALQTGDPSRLPSVLIGKPVPEFDLAAVPRLENDSGAPMPGFSSSVFKTGKVSLLNVWASWCAPCALEHPELVGLAKQGIPLYGINYKGDTADAARRFLLRHGNPFLAVGMDLTGMTAIDFGVYGVPETFVIDGSGRIVLRYPGPLTAEVIADKIMPAIRKAEKDTAASPS
ncbi:MAG: DsbE family thiol:disulfide interchange protein [Rhodomicrobium sp.]|jgi:cytochrome c biogenesis protein CcmG/thiol:disulfide interchange protein DsbE